MRRFVVTLFALLAGVCASNGFCGAYGFSWPNARTTFYTGDLQGMSWVDAFVESSLRWNDMPGGFRFYMDSGSGMGFCSSAGNNSVRWGNNSCGDSFGANTLAVTWYWYNFGPGIFTKADIVFNSNLNWGTYEGNWRPGTTEFGRVAVHELGHALGMDHTNVAGNIMTPSVSNTWLPGQDDIDTLLDIYGPESHTLRIIINGEGMLKVTPRISGVGVIFNNVIYTSNYGSFLDCAAPECLIPIQDGLRLDIEAMPDEDVEFQHWNDVSATDPRLSLDPFHAERTIIANFSYSDTDGDGVNDVDDAFPFDPAETLDSDMDGIGNNADTDDDDDGLSDEMEIDIGTDPLKADTDADGVSDYLDVFPTDPMNSKDSDTDGMGDNWENSHDFDAFDDKDALEDADNDELSNLNEFLQQTHPRIADTDNDTMPDGWELNHQLNPIDKNDAHLDLDNDGLDNVFEYRFDSDPVDPNSLPSPLGHFFESFEAGNIDPDFWQSSADVDVSWAVDSGFGVHGNASLRAVTIDDNEIAEIQFIAYFAAGTLSFDYKVSSETNRDLFSVIIDNVSPLQQSGLVAGVYSIDLDAGIHFISFRYKKDAGGFSGEDTAWIDNLEFYDALDRDGDGIANTSDNDDDNDGLPDSWETDNELDPLNKWDANLDSDNDGYSNLEEFFKQTDPQNNTSVPEPRGVYSESFEQGMPADWMNNGWEIDNSYASDGEFSLMTGDASQTLVSLTELFAGGILSFDYRITTEDNASIFSVLIDDEVQISFASGAQAGQRSIAVPEGIHTVSFQFSTTGEANAGAVWIDNIRLTADTDYDGVLDAEDNCIEVANPIQRDTDGDLYGNFCDADLDNSDFVDAADLDSFRSQFTELNDNADFDGDGFVNFSDLALFKSLLAKPPGPSGLKQ